MRPFGSSRGPRGPRGGSERCRGLVAALRQHAELLVFPCPGRLGAMSRLFRPRWVRMLDRWYFLALGGLLACRAALRRKFTPPA